MIQFRPAELIHAVDIIIAASIGVMELCEQTGHMDSKVVDVMMDDLVKFLADVENENKYRGGVWIIVDS